MNLFRALAVCDIKVGEWIVIDMDSGTHYSGPPVTKGKVPDNVNHPSHYNSGKIEVIEFIEDQKLQYHLGNTVKYIARAGKKDPSKELEDLQKAAWYLARRIENLTAEREGRAVTRPNDMVRK